ncbi:M10 family metallopeptidase C-terminal domain-containing protein [Hyphococcus sp.]|uniref:M10 family metallopeptidase C-terminal domain-containing protein n=1 Tax=Hyphococcus sp. TaxID=2038636 RepID=UPI0035C68C38
MAYDFSESSGVAEDSGRLSTLGSGDSYLNNYGFSGYTRSNYSDFLGKNVFGSFAYYPEWDPHYKGGASAVAVPSTISASNGVLSTVGSIPSEIALDGSIDAPGELDIYQVDLTAGELYMFSVYGSGADPLQDTFLYLLDKDFNVIDFDDDGGAGTMSLLTYAATTTDTYYVAIEGYPGAGLTGEYTFDAIVSPGVDVVPDTFGAAAPITLGTTQYGFIEAGPGVVYGPDFTEVDTYSFTATAGQVYSFEVAGGADYASDYLNLPDGELDTVVVIYNSDGEVVASSDDISFPSDISSRVDFFATEDGTYYMDVFSYQPWSGGYSITSQVFNPDDFDPLEALYWDSAANVPFDETNTAYVYFGEAGDTFGEPGVSLGWNEYEKEQVMLALEEYEKILGVNYEITEDVNEATFRLFTTESDQFGAYFYPQDPAYGTQQGIGAFNVLSGAWTFDEQQSLEKGGFAFAVVLHEFGHAHGLAHPHDTGGGSEIMLGVSSSTGSFGIYDLNQGVYTVMSYNDAWQTHPDGETPFTADNIDSGWSGTLGAFDIAALQERYGVINEYATGNDVYLLKDANDPGTYYETIWDTGGRDEIRYEGASDARIDLQAATLDYSPTGGGAISFVSGIWGGYTIANGVEIEKATGGSGNDVLLGNDGVNWLRGNDGDDILMGRGGGDKLIGGLGFDTASYMDSEEGVKILTGVWNPFGSGDADGDVFVSIEAIQGSNHDDFLRAGFKIEQVHGMGGDDTLRGTGGDETFFGGDDNDDIRAGSGEDYLDGEAGDDTLFGGNKDDTLLGGEGDDYLNGGGAKDVINGGAGNDKMRGGFSNDTFVFTETGYVDEILDFQKWRDKIDVSGLDAVDGGDIDAFNWIGSDGFSNTAGELRAFTDGFDNFVQGDTDGDGVADFTIMTNVLVSEHDFIFG